MVGRAQPPLHSREEHHCRSRQRDLLQRGEPLGDSDQGEIGKLDLDLPLAEIHRWVVQEEGWMVLPVEWPHIRRLDQLPSPHKDPFDRLLIAQAAEENVTLVSVDPLMRDYPVAVLG